MYQSPRIRSPYGRSKRSLFSMQQQGFGRGYGRGLLQPRSMIELEQRPQLQQQPMQQQQQQMMQQPFRSMWYGRRPLNRFQQFRGGPQLVGNDSSIDQGAAWRMQNQARI